MFQTRIAERRVAWSCAVLTAFCLMAAGCGREPPPERWVAGVVRYGGQPLREGRVTLLGPNGQIAASQLGPDGSYQIVDPPVGRCRVGVVTFPKEPPPAVPAPTDKRLAMCIVPPRPQVRVPARYAEPERSPLGIVVGDANQTRDIDLPRGPDDPPVVLEDATAIGVTIGRRAPEISGEDLAGRSLRLSAFRGQVVVLLFWGHW